MSVIRESEGVMSTRDSLSGARPLSDTSTLPLGPLRYSIQAWALRNVNFSLELSRDLKLFQVIRQVWVWSRWHRREMRNSGSSKTLLEDWLTKCRTAESSIMRSEAKVKIRNERTEHYHRAVNDSLYYIILQSFVVNMA